MSASCFGQFAIAKSDLEDHTALTKRVASLYVEHDAALPVRSYRDGKLAKCIAELPVIQCGWCRYCPKC